MKNNQIQQFQNKEEKVYYPEGSTQLKKKHRFNIFNKLLYGDLHKYVDIQNKIISKNNYLPYHKSNIKQIFPSYITNNTLYPLKNQNSNIKKLHTKHNKHNRFFCNTIQSNLIEGYSPIKGKLITQIINDKQNGPYIENHQYKQQKQLIFSSSVNSFNEKKQHKNGKKKVKKSQKIAMKRIINYENIQPKIEIMKGQYMTQNYISEKSASITNFLTRQMLEKLLESINEFKQSITKIQKLHNNFMKLKIQNQRSFNMKIQETNKLMQILFHQLLLKIQNQLIKINYYLNSDIFISSLTVADEEEAINYNLENYQFLSRQLIRLIEGFFIVYKVIEKQINEKECHEFIRYIMKIRYNINLLTKQYQYCQSQNKHPERNKQLFRKQTSLQFIKSIIKNKQLTQRKLNKKLLTQNINH